MRHSESCPKIEDVRLLFHFPRMTVDIDELHAVIKTDGIMEA
jgi:hypothetical protein